MTAIGEREPRTSALVRPTSHGRVALITGAASGLGAATSEVLGLAGYRVVAADVAADGAATVADRIAEVGGEAFAVPMDVSNDSSVEEAIAAAVERFGGLDVLINNAGVDRTAPFDELSMADWDRVIGVNLRGPVLVTRAALPVLRRSGRAHIVNVTSTAAKRAWENASAYHATKWGLLGLSHALHTEARRYGVKVTALVAGGMRTPFILERFPDVDPGTLQDPRNVADAIRFVLDTPAETVIPELMVLPMRETSWP